MLLTRALLLGGGMTAQSNESVAQSIEFSVADCSIVTTFHDLVRTTA